MKRKIIVISSVVVASLVLAVSIPFIVLGIRTASMEKKYDYLKEDELYSSKQEVSGVELVTQHISCGYATIEMMSSFYGNKVSEDDLSNKNNGGISTSSSNGFLKEIQNSIPNQKFVKHSYLKNDALLKEIHQSLKANHPVAIEWAAEDQNGTMTLHFSLVTSLDTKNDNVTIYNPYGYIENIKVADFINRTSFKAFKNMPLFYDFGFAFGAFEKNVVIYAA